MSQNDFFQEAPDLKNQFTNDPWLRAFLARVVAPDTLKKWTPHLTQMGEDAVTKLLDLAAQAEDQPPVHIPFDAWGNRIDDIKISRAWEDLQAYAATNGLIAEGYERQDGAFSRLKQMTMLYLFHPSSAMFSCPLAMTDGAARALEVYGDDDLKKTAFKHLTSRDPKQFWTSGQWMTERISGSDVGQSLTRAVKTKEGYALTGTKWFTSASTSSMAMTLARIEGAEAGGRGLSLFYIETKDAKGRLRNIEIHRLKDKLGTCAVPTAELSMKDTPAQLVGGEGHGVKKISAFFNVTRIYNAVCALGYMRRAVALGIDYSSKRKVFGRLLKDQPLNMTTLFPMWADTWGCGDFVFELVRLLGREECGEATEAEKALLRLYIPLAKLYTGKKVVQITSEVIELFGGAGYVEDTRLPEILRNAQVLPIWEGTTNVLSLDVLRALTKECPLSVWVEDQKKKISQIKDGKKQTTLNAHLDQIAKTAMTLSGDADEMAALARDFAFAITELSIATLVCGAAQQQPTPMAQAVAEHWVGRLRLLTPLPSGTWKHQSQLLFEES